MPEIDPMYSTHSNHLNPLSAKTWVERGLQAANSQGFDEARTCFENALELEPNHFEAIHHLGLIAYKLKDYFRAIGYFHVAHQIDPKNAILLSNLGSIYKELRLFELSKATYLKALGLVSTFAPLHFNYANLLHEMHDTEGAFKSYQDALKIDPRLVPAYTNGGNMLTKLRKFDEALTYYDQALRLDPQFGLAHANKGKLLKERYAFDEALEAFAKAELYAPNVAKVFVLKAELMNLMRDYEQAVLNFDKAYALDPHYEFLLGLRLHNKMLNCNWSHFVSEVNQLITSIEAGHKATQPAQLLSLVDSPSLQLRVCEIYIRHLLPRQEALGPIANPKTLSLPNSRSLAPGHPVIPGEVSTHRRIKIAYVSADFKNHAVCILMAELFELHDKTRFELIAFDSTQEKPHKKDTLRERIKSAFDEFISIKDLDDKTAAALMRAKHLDVVIDLGGHTLNSRLGTLAYRVAPVQLSYVGYLGTLGAPYIDYILADDTLIPEKNQPFYTEQLLYLPCYQVNDRKRKISSRVFKREELGLPETGFVYCCFNNNYKITPSTFAAWMTILKSVPGSVLWLLADNPTAQTNLSNNAALHGVDPLRLIFGGRLEASEYLARYKTADLFLDTWPYNAGTTATDALLVGLPVLTRMGESFASRMASSVLMGLDLPELITESIEAYQQRAIELALNPVPYQVLRDKVSNNRIKSQLFNPVAFTTHLEDGLIHALKHAQSGQGPKTFHVKKLEFQDRH